MGEIISKVYATRDDQMTKFKTGPISILTGPNLRISSEASSEKSRAGRPT